MIKLNVRYLDSFTIQYHKISMKISCIWMFAIRCKSNCDPSHIECPLKVEPKMMANNNPLGN